MVFFKLRTKCTKQAGTREAVEKQKASSKINPFKLLLSVVLLNIKYYTSARAVLNSFLC